MNKNTIEFDIAEALRVKEVKWRYAAEKPQIFLDYTYARERQDNEEIRRLEEQDQDLKEIYDEAGPCDPTDYAAYGRLVELRYECLHENETYQRYCQARSRPSEAARATRREIESAHPQIAEIFSDWGQTTDIEEDRAKWIESNRHLFYPLVFNVANAGEAIQRESFTLAFPSGIQRLKATYKKPPYTLIDRLFEVAKEFAKTMDSSPKYEIEKISGQTYAATYERLHACQMIASHTYDDTLTLADTARRYFDIAGISAFGPDQFAGTYKFDATKARERHVRTLRDTHRNCVAKIIDGIFPAKMKTVKK